MMRRRAIGKKSRFSADNLVVRIRWAREKVAQAADWLAGPVLFAGFIFFAGLALWELSKEDSNLEWMKFYAYLVGGVVLIWQVRISNRRATALEKTAALGEKGNITERFKNAIEHLANDSASVQIGGIYTLYHVAKEAGEYKETVLKILLAHLQKTLTRKAGTPRKPSKVAAAIVDALFARRGETPLFEAVDLSHIDMSGFGFREANMYDYNLSTICAASELKITGAYFGDADLCGADLSYAICENTDFNGAKCIGTRFIGISNFDGADFEGADLTEADFSESSITAQQLLEAETLYLAQLSFKIQEEIAQKRPELFDPPFTRFRK